MSEHLGGGRPGDGPAGTGRLIAGRYRLLSPLGEGGMGTVWRARDEVLGREVAVKEVRAPAGLPGADRERLYARLEREAWAAARVSNRNVVTVYDVATDDDRPWIVMELIRGLTLADVLEAEGPLEPARAARIGAEVLAALRAAHGVGVLHRDVKPGNVLVANDGRVVLTDFGIATVEGSSALTMTGEVIGSPEYLAPERALGRTPGPESDLWSLGVLLYAAVEGASPFRQDTPLGTLRAVVDEELPPPRRAGPLGPVIEGLLRKDPALRMPAGRAEQDLRVIAAGGSPESATVPVRPYPPTVFSPATASGADWDANQGAYQNADRRAGAGAGTAVRAGAGAAAARGSGRDSGATASWQAGSPDEEASRRRRTALVVAAGMALLALALAGLMYALLNRNDSGDGAAANGGANSETSESTAGATRSAAGGGGSGTGGTSSSAGASTSPSGSAPPQSVRVTLSGSNTDYTGSCPPSSEQAARLTAAFTVGRSPAQVRYRWVAEGDGSGGVPGGWRTLSFAAGERTEQETEVVSTAVHSGAYTARFHVEVGDPVTVTSNSVAVAFTCTSGETPTNGASPSVSASP